MPLPQPNAGESKDKFLDRCMGNDTMNEEYPDNKQRYAVCNSLWKQSKKSLEERVMAVKLNSKGNSNARSLVNSGKVNKSSPWSFSAADGNKLLGSDGNDWSNYSKWHLAVDTSAKDDTKAHYKYPFGKGGQVYRSALRAIRSRASQQNVTDVFNAAGRLMDMMDKEEDSMDVNIETRAVERAYMPVQELRAIEDGEDGPKLVGFAARFGKLSGDLGGFREKIARGAFHETIRQDDIRALWNHDSNYVLGRSTAGTLQLEEKPSGLWMEIDVPDTQMGRDALVSIRRGDVSQMSFGFRCIEEEWRKRKNDNDEEENIRTLKKVELFDVSPVTYPAYPDTRVQVRSAMESALGIELRATMQAIIRGRHGLGLSDGDSAVISQLIATLTDLLPGGEIADPEQVSRAIATKRREILRKEGLIRQPN